MATALQLTRKEWRSYHPRSDAKEGFVPILRSQEIKDLLSRAQTFGSKIKKEFGAKRVILFGSLARHYDFHPDSDIDLAVEGLQGSQYWEVWRIAEEYFPSHEVEVVEIETASQNMRQAINKYGIEL